MPGAATCSNAAMGTSLRCRKEKAGRIHRTLTLMVSEQHNHWLPEKTPLERFVVLDRCQFG